MLEQNPKHYLIKRSSQPKTRGVPIDLDGLFHDKPLKGGADNPIIYPWYDYEKPSPFDLPETMYFICKHKVIDFDFYDRTDGYIISERFFEIVAKMRCPDYVYRPIHILNNKAENVTEQNYYFLRFKQRLNVIDLERSEWFQARNRFEYGTPLLARFFGSEIGKPLIGVVRNPYFTNTADNYDFFNIANTSFQMDACSALFYEEVKKHKMKGVVFIQQNEFFDRVNEMDYNYFNDEIEEIRECEELHKKYLENKG